MNYTPINTQRVELADGTCLRIEGGDAAETARIVKNYIGGGNPVTNVPASGTHEPPLPVPVLNLTAAAEDSAQRPPEGGGEPEPRDANTLLRGAVPSGEWQEPAPPRTAAALGRSGAITANAGEEPALPPSPPL